MSGVSIQRWTIMKANLQESLHRNISSDWWLYTIVIVACVYLAVCQLYLSPDTETYFYAWDNYLSRGEISSCRTPIYPLYLGLWTIISSEHYLFLSVIGQQLAFVISLYYLKRMLQWFTESKSIVRLSILGFSIVVISWHNTILTESFAISGSIFFIYCLISFYQKGRYLHLIGTIIWLAFLVFLRPSFLFLFIVCLCAFGLYYQSNRRGALWGLLGVAFVGLLELGYCKCMEEKYGVFAPSEVGVDNGLQIAIVEGAISPDYSDKEEVKEILRQASEYQGKDIFDIWTFWRSENIQETLSIAEKASIVTKSRKEYPAKWFVAVWHHYLEFLTMHFPKDGGLFSILRMFVAGIELLIHGLVILYFLFCCYCAFVKKKILVINIVLWLTVMGNLATILIGAQAEWYRLFLPSVPLLMIMIVQTYSFVCKKLKSKRNIAVIASE